ncbi:unnamed protein product [Schistosoma margrebowiei]|uniref:DUF4524 domain-containing protein n=1 Tax=Schistosoma margrebowiei TaxID=48269 RepID=A0AA84ZKW3_9TREM|nr:unnamed protein product [Schistosoma margrebowiei]
MAEHWSVGPTVHFGSHSLLPSTDLKILWDLLQCRDCWFRRIYHQLAANELRSNSVVAVSPRKSSIPSVPFHSLTRAIQAVLRGFNLNRKCPSKLDTKETNLASFLHLHIKTSYHHITVVSTKFCIKRQYWVCPSHGRRLFDLLYCSGNFSIPERKDGLDFDLAIRSIIPQGQSDFFRSVQLSSSSDESDEPEQTFSVRLHTPELYIVKPNPEGSHNHLSTKVCSTEPKKFISKQLYEVNRKWSFKYSVNDLNHKHLYSKNDARHTCDSHYNERKLDGPKHVHFPKGNPISAVYNLYTYATASRLERSNRIWEIEARSRYFDRLKYLISNGFEADLASQLAGDDESTELHSSVNEALDNKACKQDNLKPTNIISKRSKPRHRKRNRKRGSNSVSLLSSHSHNATDPSISRNKIDDNYQKCVSLAQ